MHERKAKPKQGVFRKQNRCGAPSAHFYHDRKQIGQGGIRNHLSRHIARGSTFQSRLLPNKHQIWAPRALPRLVSAWLSAWWSSSDSSEIAFVSPRTISICGASWCTREQKPSSQIHGATPFSICAICAHQNADLNGFHFNALPRAAFHFLSSLLTRALIARIHQSALRAAE